MPLDLINEERATSSASSTSDPPPTGAGSDMSAAGGQSSLSSPVQTHPPAPIHHAPSFDSSQSLANGSSSCASTERMSTDAGNAEGYGRMSDIPPQHVSQWRDHARGMILTDLSFRCAVPAVIWRCPIRAAETRTSYNVKHRSLRSR